LTRRKRLPAKVISVGNLTLGGTGKTPAVMRVAKEAKKRGFNPCILTRGYRGKTKDTCFVSKGAGAIMDAAEAGDEAVLMAELLKEVPVVKGSRRYESGLFALREYFDLLTPDPGSSERVASDLTPLFILDDGFQHWALYRDIDIVLIDATSPFGNEKLVPEGILREPLCALHRADLIVVTRSDAATPVAVLDITRKLKKYNQQAPVFTASHRPLELVDIQGKTRALSSLSHKRVYAFAAIGNPLYFESLLRASGARVIQFREFRDHHEYAQSDINDIKNDALGLDIITTEKDLVKLHRLQVPENVYALRVEFSVEDSFYDNLFRRLQ
jgi:tetraacyldisaccharide 4'-kinase